MVKSLKVKCIVTGKESLFSGDYLKKKIGEYNDVDNLQRLYISRDVKTLFKRGYGVNEIRNILNVAEDIIFQIMISLKNLKRNLKVTV